MDFTAEVERSLRVLDGAIVVFCGVAGVQPQSETVWRQATKYNVPRIVFVNKMDRTGANFDSVFNEVKEKLGANAVRILIPIGAEDHLIGQIDVVNQKAIYFSDDDKFGSTYTVKELEGELDRHRRRRPTTNSSTPSPMWMTQIGEKFLEEEPISLEELKQGIRRATIANKLVPVAGGSAFKNKGVQYLLDAVVDYLPSPLDIPPAIGMDPDNEEHQIEVVTSRQREVRRPRLQTLGRQVRRQTRFLPRLFRRHQEGRHGLQSPHPPLRARRPPDPDPGQRAQGHRRLLRR